MFGDIDWPLNASCGFVSISWASYFTLAQQKLCHTSISYYNVYRASACYACRAQYCFVNFNRLSVHLPSNADIVSKRMDTYSCFWRSGRDIIPVSWDLLPFQNSNENPLTGVLNRVICKICSFRQRIAIYTGNGTRYANGYYGSLIGSGR